MAIKSDSARFESWPNGLALYIDYELKASCVLGHMRSTDLKDLEYFDLSAISNGTLRIRKKILRYGYNDENSCETTGRIEKEDHRLHFYAY